MPAVKTGERFGRLTVVDPGRFDAPGPSQVALGMRGSRSPLCRCDCGTELQVRQSSLRSGCSRSCGCLQRELASTRTARVMLTHGKARHYLFDTWRQMIKRCEHPGHPAYRNYGGRGIRVCDRWHDVAVFIADIERWLGPKPAGMTLDRIQNDHDYRLDNMRWATRKQQQNNRRVTAKA